MNAALQARTRRDHVDRRVKIKRKTKRKAELHAEYRENEKKRPTRKKHIVKTFRRKKLAAARKNRHKKWKELAIN